MLRSVFLVLGRKPALPKLIQSCSFLTNAYRCTEAWNERTSSPILQKVNLEDFYNAVDQIHSSKGVMSALDVDIFANSMKDDSYLEELRDLLHKLRLTADTGNTLDSTHHAAVRTFIECGQTEELLQVLWDPLNYGIFLDQFTANILMDELLKRDDYEKAAMAASLVMLQEDYSNNITCSLALYSCYKYIANYKPAPPAEQPEAPKGKQKVEEVKIRVKFLRNPYFDDHFDLKDPLLRMGKTLAWISQSKYDNLHGNLQILGWLLYKKYDKLLSATQSLAKSKSPKVYKEVLQYFQEHKDDSTESIKALEECTNYLKNLPTIEASVEEDLKTLIENAINNTQQNDILQQKQLFTSWEQNRQEKLSEQTKRLDEARRIQALEEKQRSLSVEEQKLWFFENEDKLDLEIEKKIVYYPKKWFGKKKKPRVVDEGYIPPEILPKRQ